MVYLWANYQVFFTPHLRRVREDPAAQTPGRDVSDDGDLTFSQIHFLPANDTGNPLKDNPYFLPPEERASSRDGDKNTIPGLDLKRTSLWIIYKFINFILSVKNIKIIYKLT